MHLLEAAVVASVVGCVCTGSLSSVQAEPVNSTALGFIHRTSTASDPTTTTEGLVPAAKDAKIHNGAISNVTLTTIEQLAFSSSLLIDDTNSRRVSTVTRTNFSSAMLSHNVSANEKGEPDSDGTIASAQVFQANTTTQQRSTALRYARAGAIMLIPAIWMTNL